MSFPYLDETKELNESTRKEAAGSFIALTDGVTHYELSGDGPTVVMVHGFSTPYFIFDITFEFLVNSGFQVLRYDLLGRGFSDRPNTSYSIELFVRQLKDLLDTLNLKGIHLMGLSMGGPITAAFIDKYPEYVHKHVLIDPAGARPFTYPFLLTAVKIPWLGELFLGLFGSGGMVKSIASDLFTSELVQQFQARYRIQMQYKGFKRAILSTVRSGMLGSFIEVYARLGQLKKPTLLLWGRQDKTVPFKYSQDILAVMPQIQFNVIENCGHLPHYEKPAEVNPILLEFLQRKTT